MKNHPATSFAFHKVAAAGPSRDLNLKVESAKPSAIHLESANPSGSNWILPHSMTILYFANIPMCCKKTQSRQRLLN